MSTYPPPARSPSSGTGVVVVVVLAILAVLGLAVVGCGMAGFLFFRMAARDAQQAAEAAQADWEAMPMPAPLPAPYTPEAAYVPQPVPGYTPTGERVEWYFPSSPEGASGTIKKTGEKVWTETRSDGFTHTFTETAATNEHIELHDASRSLDVRLFADHIEWKRSDQAWTRGQAGSWKPKQ